MLIILINAKAMKVEKLLTLSQMIDWLNKERPFSEDLSEGSMSEYSDMMVFLMHYNTFLKQPLTKEMFVNPLEEPTDMFHGEQYYGAMIDSFQEAEKEVIFEGEWILKTDDRFDNIKWIEDKSGNYHPIQIYGQTLNDLAEITSGVLALKNITL